MKKYLLLASALAFVAAPLWADDEDEEQGKDTRPYVSINQEDIINKTDNPGANFKGLIDRLNNELVECGLYRVMNMEDLFKAVKKNDVMKVAADDGGKESKIETPGFFIGMTIMKYGLNAGAEVNRLSGTATALEEAKVELILKVVNAQTGETVKSKNLESGAKGSTTMSGNLREQVLQVASKSVCKKIVQELVKLTPFAVLDVEDGVVQVDVPGSIAKPGMQMIVLKQGKGKKSKRTGKVTKKESKVATIGITSVTEDSCSAKLIEGKIEPIGDDEDTQYDPYIVRFPDGDPGKATPPPPAPAADAIPF